MKYLFYYISFLTILLGNPIIGFFLLGLTLALSGDLRDGK